ncbi:3-phosphoglycerate dehydrogenase family protein [Legionella sp. W05-934-2]|jgi:D-3-phosphoglycerate dehydrogenase|uniref:3-phosphoglycerate dehydrogenase family protein n=1 Tax=Legionella sp. W05-934-2 TaxID=1198649 RepID=UPI0034625EFD
MFKIKIIDHYPQKTLANFDSQQFETGEDFDNPDVILVRSTKLHDHPFSDKLKAVGRAGTGIDNIPVEKLTQQGIPVFYAPGANANAVKELVVAAMIMAYRNIRPALSFIDTLKQELPSDLSSNIEQNKKRFAGQELSGKTLGIIGAGNIGVKVANIAHHLGMHVITYDPMMTLSSALALIPDVNQAESIEAVLSQSDIISLHVPLVPETKHLINQHTLSLLKPDAVLANFSREGIVDEKALLNALDQKQLKSYMTDFATAELVKRESVICFPHLGASTQQAQENASSMVITNVKNFLEFGTVSFSANFPETRLVKPDSFKGYRLVIANENKPGVIAEMTQAISRSNLNIERMVNSSNEAIAFNLVDITGDEGELQQVIKEIEQSNHVLNVRLINYQ